MIKRNEKVLLVGRRNYLVKANSRFSTQFGEFDLKALVGKKWGSRIKTHLGEEFYAVQPRTPDLLRRIKRAPQIITNKDAGLIAGYCGLSKRDVVLEAGTGSAYLTIFLAGIVKKVYSYEVRTDFFKVATENLKACGVRNVVLKNKDVGKAMERDIDVAILDLGSPEKCVGAVKKCLKPGGFLVIYSPVMQQVERIRKVLKGFENIQMREAVLREWQVGDNKTRPKTRAPGHTGFLTFARKV